MLIYMRLASSSLFFYQAKMQRRAAALLDLSWPVVSFLAFYEEDLIFIINGGSQEAFEEPLHPNSNLIQQ